MKQSSRHADTQLQPPSQCTNLQDLLDAVDGGGEQRADLLVIVVVVGVSQTHEEDVGWQARDQVHSDAARLQLWRDGKSSKKPQVKPQSEQRI